MTNDLRTRIAAVLYARAMSDLAWHRSWDDLQPEVQQMWLDDADAVIRELGDRECAVECAVCKSTYSVRADAPGWSSVWTCCISCQVNEDV